jgi:hypothetical protein
MEEPIRPIVEVESVKIEKNSKGFNYEYRLVGRVEEQIQRIPKIEEDIKKQLNIN